MKSSMRITTKFHALAMRFCCLNLLLLFKLNGVTIPKNLEKAKYITITKCNDGFGSQLQRRMSAIAFAIAHNKEYVHRPFVKIDHNYKKKPQFPQQMEYFANIGCEFLQTHAFNKQDLYTRIDYSNYIDQNIDKYYTPEVLSFFRKNYYSTPKPLISYFEKERINVAVHVRRGDIVNQRPIVRWMPDSHYLKVMNTIRKIHPKAKFYVYSEGKAKNFKKFQANDVELHLDEDIKATFHALVTADILITSKGAFSYTAALLSEGIIYHTKYQNAKLAHWIKI